jgi:hypothetical protein
MQAVLTYNVGNLLRCQSNCQHEDLGNAMLNMVQSTNSNKKKKNQIR